MGATYPRMMEKVFESQIGRNMEVYDDEMVVTGFTFNHVDNLIEVFNRVRRCNIRLNLERCSFGVQVGKFLGFMLTCRGIKANLVSAKR